MKAVFITYNQVLTERIDEILNRAEIKGYTMWEQTFGRGSKGGEPHMGSHTWPSMNSTILAITEDEKVMPLLRRLKVLDKQTEMQGLRAFVWNVEDQV